MYTGEVICSFFLESVITGGQIHACPFWNHKEAGEEVAALGEGEEGSLAHSVARRAWRLAFQGA